MHAADRATWRAWLAEHHATVRGAWLVMRRPGAGRPEPRDEPPGAGAPAPGEGDAPGVDYEAAVEEAVCFGWIDGQLGRIDAQRSKLYFAPRRPRGTWSASNRARVERLLAAGLMAPAGIAAVERAKSNGAWSQLEAIERLEVPDDLAAALETVPPAAERFAAFSASSRMAILGWIASARRPETRQRRILQAASMAQRGERANEQRREG